MDLLYNIDFELAGVLFVCVIYIALRIYYSEQSEVNRKFKTVVKCIMAAETMDIVTAVTISYGRVIPPQLNLLINTVYFVLTFSLGYSFFCYVVSYIGQDAGERRFVKVNKFIYILFLAMLVVNLFTGILFSFSPSGEYVHGTMYLAVYAVVLYFILCSAGVLIRN